MLQTGAHKSPGTQAMLVIASVSSELLFFPHCEFAKNHSQKQKEIKPWTGGKVSSNQISSFSLEMVSESTLTGLPVFSCFFDENFTMQPR